MTVGTQPTFRREYFAILLVTALFLATIESQVGGPLVPGVLLTAYGFVLITWMSFLRPDLMFLGAFVLSIILPVEIGVKWEPLPRIGPSIFVLAALLVGGAGRLVLPFGSGSIDASFRRLPMKPLWGFFIASYLVSGIESIARLASCYAIGKQAIMMLVLTVLASSFFSDPSFWPRFRTALYWATAFTCGYAIYEELTRQNIFLSFYPTEIMEFRSGILRVRSTFFHPIAFGTYLAMVYPFILVDVWRRRRLATIALLVLTVLGSFCTVSRGPWVALVVESAVIGLVLIKREPRIFAAMCFGFLSLICLIFTDTKIVQSFDESPLLNPSQQSLKHLDERSSEFYRIAVVAAAVDRMEGARWFYGFGPGTFYLADVSSHYSGENHVLTAGDSQYALTLVERGGFGLSILVLVIANSIRICSKAVRRTTGCRRLLASACFASILGFAINCTTASMFLLLPLNLFFWVVVILASNLSRAEAQESKDAATAYC